MLGNSNSGAFESTSSQSSAIWQSGWIDELWNQLENGTFNGIGNVVIDEDVTQTEQQILSDLAVIDRMLVGNKEIQQLLSDVRDFADQKHTAFGNYLGRNPGIDTLTGSRFASPAYQAATSLTEVMQYVQSQGLPDLSAEVSTPTFDEVALPGEKANLSITLKNQGGLRTRHPVTVKIYAQAQSGAGSSENSPLEIGALNFDNLKLKPGQDRRVSTSVQLPDNLAPGDYSIYVAVDSNNNVPESNEANNIVVAATDQTVAWQFGNLGDENKVLTLRDEDGDLIRFQLKGDGYGEITEQQGVRQLTLYGTTERSEVVIKSSGNGHVLGGVVVNGDLKRLDAQNTDLEGNLTITGAIEKLELDDVSNAQITIGQGSNSNRQVDIALGEVTNTSLRSDVSIKGLKAATWTASPDAAALLVAPEIKELDIRGDFDTNLAVAGSINTIKVKGTASGIWRVGQNNRLTRLESSTTSDWSLSVGGSLNYLDVQADLQGTVAAASMKRAYVRGDVSGAKLLIGADLGADGVVGGDDDTYNEGELKELIVGGSVLSSVIGVGLDPLTTNFTNGDGQLITTGKIGLVDVKGTVSDDSLFAAEHFTQDIEIGEQTVSAEVDSRFLLPSKVTVDASDSSSEDALSLDTTTSTADIRQAKQQSEKLWSFEARAGGITTYEFAIGPNGAQTDLHQQAEHVWENGEEIAWSLQVEEQTVQFVIDGQLLTYPVEEALSLNALSLYTKVNTTNENKVGEGTAMALEIHSVNQSQLESPLLLSSEGPNDGQDLDQLFVSKDGLISSVSGVARMSWPEDAPDPRLKNSQGRVTFYITGYDYEQTTGGIVLQENEDFSPTYTQSVTVPDDPSSLSFTFDADFDTASIGEIRDAFEVALLDQDGRSLVHTVGSNQDVFFNLTEGVAQESAAGVSIDGNRITLDVSDLAPRTEAQLVFRLVNNDDDTQTTVRINSIEVSSESGGDLSITPSRTGAVTQAVDLTRLEDVSGWLRPAYGQTSFNGDTAELLVEVAAQNVSAYPVRDQLVMVVESISDPSVSVVKPDGRTPEGKAYFNLSSLLGDEVLASEETSEFLQLVFRNPNQVQFDYELSFLSELNDAPEFVSAPNLEALVGKPYRYDAEATDSNGDTLSYSLFSGPEGLSVDSETGELVWNPTETDLGTTQVTIQVDDGQGGVDEQTYTLSVKDNVPNRPPIITTAPVVDAQVSKPGSTEIFDLSTWTVEQYDFTNRDVPGDWVVSADGTVVEQLNNSNASIFLSPTEFSNERIEGTFRTNTTEDDDFIGFVFGYQDNQHYYLFDWKQKPQNAPYGPSESGMHVRVVNSEAPLDGEDFWLRGEDNEKIKTLYSNDIAYSDQTDYQFSIDLTPGAFTITVREGDRVVDSITVEDDTFAAGKFGFFNMSQKNVFYSGFQSSEVPASKYTYDVDAIDPDQDELTYSLVDAPEGMWVEPTTGIIHWQPTIDDLEPSIQGRKDEADDLPQVSGFDVDVYASVTDPVELAFAPNGVLYVGRDNRGSGGGILDPVKIHRISRNSTEVREYGSRSVDDPDTVLFDRYGSISGFPGTVIVGGRRNNSYSSGSIQSILEDEQIVNLFGPSSTLGNVSTLTLDNSGRLLFTNSNFGKALVSTDGEFPEELFTHPGRLESIAIDSQNRIFTAGAEDGTIRIYSANGELLNDTFATGLGSHRVAFGQGGVWGSSLYAVKFDTGELLRFSEDGSADIVGTGFSGVFDFAFGPDGAMYVSELENDRVLRISPDRESLGLEDGEHQVQVAVDDGNGGVDIQKYVVKVTPPKDNRAPIIVSNPVTALNAAQEEFALGSRGASIVSVSSQYDFSENLSYTPTANGLITAQENLLSTAKTPWLSNGEAGFAFKRGDSDQNLVLDLGGERLIDQIGVNYYPYPGDREVWDFIRISVSTDNETYVEWGSIGSEDGRVDVTTAPLIINQPDQFVRYIKYEFGPSSFDYSRGGSRITDLYANQTGANYFYDVDAIDPDKDTLTYSLMDAPDGMTIDKDKGFIRWDSASVEAYKSNIGEEANVTVRTVDQYGAEDTQNYTISLSSPDEEPATHDLTIDDVEAGDLVFDGQLLSLSGNVSATIANEGSEDLTDSFDVVFFEDSNQNQAFDADTDNILGRETVVDTLLSGRSRSISTSLSGFVSFSGVPIWGVIDSEDSIRETDESNNTDFSSHDCIAKPVGEFNPVVEWNKRSFSVASSSHQVMMTPAVIDLNKDGTPDVIFTTFAGRQYQQNGKLRAISGDEGRELWTVTNSAYDLYPGSGIAVGDIDNDGYAEIIGNHEDGSVIAFEHDGSFKWKSTWQGAESGSPAIADLDHNGSPEIIFRNIALDSEGNLLWQGDESGGLGSGSGWSAVADLDLDGAPEIVAGRSAYRADGSLYWNAAINDGYSAIGNFDLDPFPEIVVTGGYGGNEVHLLEHTGDIKWTTTLPTTGGGNPTVADFDGDGLPEIGVAGASRYVAIETDGSIKWASATQDTSSRTTGSSVFDFDGDGRAEVVYGDERYLRIYDGTDGRILFQSPKTSGTLRELPVIADVDADGNAEIVAIANDYSRGTQQRGIIVYGDLNNTWVPTRQIWNQHSYHITNINDDGSIPAYEENSWQLYNSYRLNLQPGSNPLAAPDLIASYVRVEEIAGEATITARVGNGGAKFTSAGVNVAFYDGNPETGGRLVGVTQTTTQLIPGAFEDISVTVPAGSVDDVWVVVDDDGTGHGSVLECHEDNNAYSPGISLQALNQRPIITTTALTEGAEGETYRYDVDATDADTADQLSFSLRVAPEGMTVDEETGVIEWTPSGTDAGTHDVQVMVSDDKSRDIQLFTIDVADLLNVAPNIDSNPGTSAVIGKTYRYDVNASDPEGDALTYELTLAPNGMVIEPATGKIAWKPSAEQLGSYDVIVKVHDGRGGIDLQAFTLAVETNNEAPIITSPPALTAIINLPYEYRVRAQDADGEVVGYRLQNAPEGMTIDEATGVVRWMPAVEQLGSAVVEVIAIDNRGAETQQQFTVGVVATAENEISEVTSSPRTSIRVNTQYLYQIAAEDPNGDPLSYRVVEGPEGMAVDEEGLVSWTPSVEQQGVNTVQLEISDGRGGVVIQQFEVAVSNVSVNSAPEITSTPEGFGATVERPYRYSANAFDADGDVVRWQLVDAPTGMSIDPEAGTLHWQPTADQLGRHTITLEVIDSRGAFTGQSFELFVRGTNLAPLISSTPITAAYADQAYQYQVQATDAEGDTLSYRLVQAPEGMSINSQTGLIDWQPDPGQSGATEVTVEVSDAAGGSTAQTYRIEVSDVAPNEGPAITSRAVSFASPGDRYRYQVIAEDPNGDALTYDLIAGPDGMSIDSATGELIWEPTSDDVGSYTVVVGANDGQLGSAQRFTLQVAVNDAPEILSNPVLTALAGETYRYDLRARDANGDRLSYELVEAPEGMTIDQYGRIRWTPNAVGGADVEIAVSDSYGATTLQRYSLTTKGDEIAPTVNIFPSIAPADVNQPLSVFVQATDNVGVVNQTLTIDGTPVALNSGAYRFTPTEAGDVTAIATATDAAGNTTTTETILEVRDFSNSGIAPTVSLDPLTGQTLTGPTDILGSVQDDNLVAYTLSLARLGSTDFREIYRGTNTVDDGDLGQLDTSLFQNDSYTLRLTAEDGNGNVVFVDETVNIGGDLKLGNFTLSFTDMELPVSGIPVTVTRTYDSLNASETDDFGYGWRLEFRDTDLRTSLGRDEQYETFGIRSQAFDEETKVYITLPGGQRQGFTFAPKKEFISNFFPAIGGGDPSLYQAAFKADDGVTSTLSVRSTQKLSRRANGSFIGLQGSGFNPEDPLFGGVYVLTTKEGIEYEIDASTGDLLTAKDLNGNTVTFEDSGIYSDNGTQITFGRDVQGRITSATDPAGQSVTYEYDSNGDLVAVRDRGGDTTRFDYSDEFAHYLDEVIDPLGRSGVRSEYDGQGRLVQMLDVNGEAVELVYDSENSQQTVLDVFDRPTAYIYDARGNVLTEIDAVGKVTKRSYDDNNNVLSETVITDESGPDGWTTTYTYDANRNQTSMTDALGNTTYYNYGENSRLLSETDALGNTTTYAYDSRGNMLTTTDAAGQTTEMDYSGSGNILALEDALGNSSRFSYNLRRDVTSMTDAGGDATAYEYDIRGNRTVETRTVTTENGTEELVTRWTYDGENRVQTMTDAAGGVTTYEYDDNGNQTAVIDALGNRTEMRYDERGQLIETIYADGTPDDLSDNTRTIDLYDRGGRRRASIDQAGQVTHFVYDAVDRLIETIHPEAGETLAQLLTAIAPGETLETVDWTQVVYSDLPPAYLSDNDRIQTEYTKDGRVKASIDERGNRTEYRYDAVGRLIETIYADETPDDLSDNPTMQVDYDAVGRRLSETDALGRTTSYVYDNVGRVVETIFHDGSSTQVSYDALGRRESVTDQAGKVTEYIYDNVGRLAGVRDAEGFLTEYRYDELGRLIEAEDANEQVTEYTYDKLGRRTAVELPLGQRSSSTYDAAGNLLTYTDFNGEVTQFIYDEQNRLIFKDYEDDADVSYTYTANGLIETITDSRGVTRYDYDEQNRLLSRTDPDGPTLASGATIEYSYDEAGNRASVMTPNGSVTYDYDERNRLTTVIDADYNLTAYGYDDANNLIRTEFANGVVETREYDDLNRLTVLENKVGDTVISGYRYELNAAGHRLSVTEASGRQVGYTYDDLYRLTEENINDGERTISYVYDNVGNRLTRDDSAEGVSSYTYDGNDRLLTETLTKDGVTVDSITYGYDDNGNLTERVKNGTETTAYVWNDDNRLVRAELPNGDVAEYAYDDEGIRISSTVNGETTSFLLDKNRSYAQVLEEFASDELAAYYVYGHDLISQERGDETSFYQVDGLGSTRVLTDELGTVTDTYDYDAFGNLINSSEETNNSYRFAGERFDNETKNYYLRERFYSQENGRFIRRDTFEGYRTRPVTRNHYLYANANPVTYVDPSGFISISELSTARKVQDILGNTFANSLRIGNNFLNALDKVNETVSLFQSLQQAFNLASNPTGLLPNLTSSALEELPSFEEAASSLRANAGKIFASVVGLKIPREQAQTAKFLNKKTSAFLFFLPSLFQAPSGTNIRTGLSIRDKPVHLGSNSNRNRLFGVGMQLKANNASSPRIQFFRMDHGSFNHVTGEDRRNHNTWQDGDFHYHVPKNG
ncbi:putative Ig domain-containing protein [cf. Phormidesmis sp. LEGE 11477]|uniref:putative Ig domain-containing protein n=1 Tax=cf. Phormidesmis sp. LEGE 11477 TaxID=1828680 RepID=UPI00187E9A33|nr:putative Ig domain-containing protein [cf. Phormidesmis sp. LEGE 11477]MBE9061400.1 putative Ig domain-containing protein [cf. Phormidesmis sp. LEGE 11477]